MSMPNIPSIEPSVTVTRNDAVNIILSSIGMEELSLSHILNAEAEKIQFALGTLETSTGPTAPASLEDILLVNKTAGKMLRDVVKNQMLLGMKLEDVMDIETTTSTTTTTTTSTTTTTTTSSEENP